MEKKFTSFLIWNQFYILVGNWNLQQSYLHIHKKQVEILCQIRD